jgi:hypothetical protein
MNSDSLRARLPSFEYESQHYGVIGKCLRCLKIKSPAVAKATPDQQSDSTCIEQPLARGQVSGQATGVTQLVPGQHTAYETSPNLKRMKGATRREKRLSFMSHNFYYFTIAVILIIFFCTNR